MYICVLVCLCAIGVLGQGVRDLASDSQQCHLLDTRDPQQLLLEGMAALGSVDA